MDTGSYRAEHRRIDDAGNAWIWHTGFALAPTRGGNEVGSGDVGTPETVFMYTRRGVDEVSINVQWPSS